MPSCDEQKREFLLRQERLYEGAFASLTTLQQLPVFIDKPDIDAIIRLLGSVSYNWKKVTVQRQELEAKLEAQGELNATQNHSD